MPKAWIKFLFFLILFLAGSYTASKIYTQYQRQHYRAIDEIKKIKSLQTVILGDSQAVRGLDPVEFRNAFNYASLGENIVLSYYKVQDLLKHRSDIQTLIVTVSLGYFTETKADYFSRLYLWKDMIDFRELAQVQGNALSQIKKYFFAEFFAYKSMRKNFFRRYFAKMKYETPYYRGFRPKPVGYFYDVSKRAKQYYKDKDKNDPVLWFYTKAFLNLAYAYDIDVLMIRMPVSRSYYDKAMQELVTDDLSWQINQLKLDYPNLHFVDYMHEFWGDEDKYFFDDLHLNKDGASILSRKLGENIFFDYNL